MAAAWNISPNEIVYDIFPGMIHAAIRSNAVIIPVGIERFNAHLYGFNCAQKVFKSEEYENIITAQKELRAVMAELKYSLYFHHDISHRIWCKRADIGDFNDYHTKFKEDILSGWTFTEEMIENKKFSDSTKPRYVFEYVIKKYINLNKSGLSNTQYADLISEIKNPIYPTYIHNKLIELLNKYIGDDLNKY